MERVLRVLVLVAAMVPAAGTVAAMLWANGITDPAWAGAQTPGDLLTLLLFALINLAPFALLGLWWWIFRASGTAVQATLLVGTLAIGVWVGSALLGFVRSESSTAALVFVTLPFVAGLAAGVVGLLTGLVWRIGRGRADADRAPEPRVAP